MTKRFLAAVCCALFMTIAPVMAQETTPEATPDSDATAEITAESTETTPEIATPEATSAPLTPGYARVRVGHYAAGVGDVDVYIDTQVTHSAVPYGAMTNYVSLDSAQATITITNAGGALSAPILEPITVGLDGESLYTLAIAPDGVTLIDESATIAAGLIQRAHVILFNAIPDTTMNVDFYNAEVGVPIDSGTAADIAYNTFAMLNPSPTNALLQLGVTSAEGELVEQQNTIELRRDLLYMIGIYGDAAEPQIALTESGTQSIAAILAESSDFSLLYAMIVEAGLLEMLDQDSPFTFFAPNNDTITTFLTEQGLYTDTLLSDPDLLNAILRYHVSRGLLFSDDVASLALIPMLNGVDTAVVVSADSILLNPNDEGTDGVTITVADVFATNGVIHVIDQVLVAPAS